MIGTRIDFFEVTTELASMLFEARSTRLLETGMADGSTPRTRFNLFRSLRD